MTKCMKTWKKQNYGARLYPKLVLNKLKAMWGEIFIFIHYSRLSSEKKLSQNISRNFIESFPNYIMDERWMKKEHLWINFIHDNVENDDDHDVAMMLEMLSMIDVTSLKTHIHIDSNLILATYKTSTKHDTKIYRFRDCPKLD